MTEIEDPSEVHVTERTFMNGRQQRLHAASYAAATSRAQAVLFIHHGVGEHCGRYDRVCRLLARNGIEVHTFDVHGHGRSEPLDEPGRAFVADYVHLVDDLVDYMDWVLQVDHPPRPAPAAPPDGRPGRCAVHAEPRPPAFLLGHSMGGMVAALAALRRQAALAGLLLSSPAVDVEWTPVLRVQAAAGGLLSALLPHAKLVPAARPEDMSPDPEAVARMLADPLNAIGNVRVRTASEALRGQRELQARAGELTLPVHVAHGTMDRCTSFAASRRFVEGPGGCVSSQDKAFSAVEGGYHELFHGPEWEACTLAALEWMRSRSPAAGAVAAAGLARATVVLERTDGGESC